MNQNKCVFLDRDGVINQDYENYVYSLDKLKILPGIVDAIKLIKDNGFKIIVITNQSGIDKGLYQISDVDIIHAQIQKEINYLIDDFYFCPYNREKTGSIARKPDSLMFEKAIYKYKIDVNQSYMVGDRVRDLIPAQKLGIATTILLDSDYNDNWDGLKSKNLFEATNNIILK